MADIVRDTSSALGGVQRLGAVTSTTTPGDVFTTLVTLTAVTPLAAWQQVGTQIMAILADGRLAMTRLASSPATPVGGSLWLQDTAGITALYFQGTQGLVTAMTGTVANNQVAYGSGGSLTGSSAFTYNGTTLTLTQPVATTGSPAALSVIGGAHTTLASAQEDSGAVFNFSAIKQWATGALTTQREFLIQAPTYRFVGASVVTNAATLAITGAPQAGTNATLTNSYALWVQTGLTKLDGALTVTGLVTARPAATQDAVVLLGRAGGTSSYAVSLATTTLTATRTQTFRDSTGNIALDAVDNLFLVGQTIDKGTGSLPVPLNVSGQCLTLANIDTVPSNIEGFGFGGVAMNIRGRSIGSSRFGFTPTAAAIVHLNLAGVVYDGSTSTDGAAVRIVADGLASGANHGTYLEFYGTSNGSTTYTEWARLQNGLLGLGMVPVVGNGSLQVAGATLFDKGTGALPAPINSSRLIETLAVADGFGPLIEGFSFAGGGFSLRPRIADGTRAVPTAAIADAVILDITPSVYDGTTWRNNTGRLVLACDGLQSAGNRGTYWALTGTSNGSTTTPEWMRLQNGLMGVGIAPAVGGGIVQISGATGALPTPVLTTPTLRLAAADGVITSVEMASWGIQSRIQALVASGTRATPTASTAGLAGLIFSLAGHDGTAYTSGAQGQYIVAFGSTWSGANREVLHQWTGTPNASITAATWMTLQNAALGIGAAPTSGAGLLQIVSTGIGARITSANNSGALDFYCTNAGTAGNRNFRINAFVSGAAGTERYEFQRITDAGVYSGSLLGIGVSGQGCPFAFAGGILIGTTDPNGATAGNGYLQFVAGTTQATGWAFGTDVHGYRDAANRFTLDATNGFTTNGARYHKVRTFASVGATDTIVATDEVWESTGTTAVALTLPAATVGRHVVIFNGNSSANVTVSRAGADTINNGTGATVLTPGIGASYTCIVAGSWRRFLSA